MDKAFFIAMAIVVFSVLSIISVCYKNNKCHKTDESMITKKPIETQIPLGKIVCIKMTSDGCVEYIIYKTIKE